MKHKINIGSDISKKTLDFFCMENQEWFKLTNDDDGLNKLKLWIEHHNFKLEEIGICFENTGSYGKLLEKFCYENKITYYERNGLDIKLSSGITRGKSDPVDAKRIASFLFEKGYKLSPTTPNSATIEKIKQLKTTRDLIVKERASFKSSLKNDTDVLKLNPSDTNVVVKEQLIKIMTTEISKIEIEINKLISESKEIKTNYDLIMTITGIGPIIALDTIIATRNFTAFKTWRHYASYCGSAPFENSSGTKTTNKRISRLSSKHLKGNLTSGARAAALHDQEMVLYIARKLAEGKSKKSLINVVRCKLISRMFSVTRNQKAFQKNYTHNLVVQST